MVNTLIFRNKSKLYFKSSILIVKVDNETLKSESDDEMMIRCNNNLTPLFEP